MGRIPCCEKDSVKRGQWTPEEDAKLVSYISQHGTRNWRLIPKNADLQRCGKSCRLRWTNYLRPDLEHDEFTENEEETMVKLHAVMGNRVGIELLSECGSGGPHTLGAELFQTYSTMAEILFSHFQTATG